MAQPTMTTSPKSVGLVIALHVPRAGKACNWLREMLRRCCRTARPSPWDKTECCNSFHAVENNLNWGEAKTATTWKPTPPRTINPCPVCTVSHTADLPHAWASKSISNPGSASCNHGLVPVCPVRRIHLQSLRMLITISQQCASTVSIQRQRSDSPRITPSVLEFYPSTRRHSTSPAEPLPAQSSN